jgi:ribosome biogenesis GTPase
MKEGVILKGIGGLYDVMADGEVFQCRPRGRFRIKGISPMVGDRVRFAPPTDTAEGVLEEILSRKNTLLRPAVANIDCLAVVLSVTQPDPDLYLADKLMISAERMDVSCLLIINKTDLASPEKIDEIADSYRAAGYSIHCVSGKLGRGMDELCRDIKGITTLAGQSGVGKSSIINYLHPSVNLKTGEVSKKIKRGRHTTRHVELLPLPYGGMIVDTPGFSQLEIRDLEPNELKDYYPEFRQYGNDCYFSGCTHVSEPDCAVKQAVEEGILPEDRYERYVYLIKEIIESRRNVW